MARFYGDENFPLPVVEELRALGHDVLTIHETGKSGQGVGDADILDAAKSDQRVVLTLNRKHFIQLHRQRPGHAGVVVCTVDSDFVALARRIHAAIGVSADLMGSLIRVNRPGPNAPSSGG